MKRTYYTYLFGTMLGIFTLGLLAAPAEAINLRDWGDQIPNPNKRFKVLNEFNGEAVLDKETQLVWQKTVSPTEFDWGMAVSGCLVSDIGGRLGWRLPAYPELASLFDRTQSNPALPAGHPFEITLPSRDAWTMTSVATDPSLAVTQGFSGGFLGSSLKDGSAGKQVPGVYVVDLAMMVGSSD